MVGIKAVVLGGGMGKRLGSESAGIPKVMRLANGKPLLAHVVQELNLPSSEIIIVAGYMKDAVIGAFPEHPIAVQERQLGTGDAVKCAMPLLNGFDGGVLICCGDMPLVRRESYDRLAEVHLLEHNDVTLMTGVYPEQMPFGRIVRDSDGRFERIVEAKDSDAELDKIREYNVGIYIFAKFALERALGKITTNNAQGEYYLTDAPAIIRESGGKVGICALDLGNQMVGVSTEEDLKLVETLLKNA